MLLRILITLLLCACPLALRADTLILANGDKISGEIVEWAVDHVVLEHPQLGRVRLTLDQLEIDTGTPPNPGLFDTNFMRGWNRSLSYGFNGKLGNTDSTNMTAGFNFNFEDEFKRWLFAGRYYFNQSDDGDADNNGSVDLRRDWLWPGSRWFAFAQYRFQFDEFESWKYRSTMSVGPGFNIIDTGPQRVDTRLGATFTREFGDRDTDKGEALFAIDYSWKPSKKYTLRASNQFFLQVFPNENEYRNLTLAELKILLAENPSLNLTLGFENEYETAIEPGDVRYDFKYYIAFGLDF